MKTFTWQKATDAWPDAPLEMRCQTTKVALGMLCKGLAVRGVAFAGSGEVKHFVLFVS